MIQREICCCLLWLHGRSLLLKTQLIPSPDNYVFVILYFYIWHFIEKNMHRGTYMFPALPCARYRCRKLILRKELNVFWKPAQWSVFPSALLLPCRNDRKMYVAYSTQLGKEKGKGNLCCPVLAECKNGKAKWGWIRGLEAHACEIAFHSRCVQLQGTCLCKNVCRMWHFCLVQ